MLNKLIADLLNELKTGTINKKTLGEKCNLLFLITLILPYR